MDFSVIFLPLMLGVMYFFFLRPQMKQQKELKEQQSNLKKGNLVLINNSIHGKIVQAQEGISWVMVDVGGGQHLKVERSAISIFTIEKKDDKK